MKLQALDGKVLVNDIDGRGEQYYGSIILPKDDGEAAGIRCRWCKVFSVGKDITAVKEGEWVLVVHGQWTRSIRVQDENGEPMELWQVNWPDAVLAAADEPTKTWTADQVVQGTDVSQLTR